MAGAVARPWIGGGRPSPRAGAVVALAVRGHYKARSDLGRCGPCPGRC